MKRLFVMMCALFALRAGADTLGDVRNAVSRLSAKPPVRATFLAKQFTKASGRYANEKAEQSVSAEVTHDAAGVSITLPQTLLDEVSRARNKGDSSKLGLIGSIQTIPITEALDFRDSLLAMLENAIVKRDERAAFHGSPARRLVLTLRPRTAKDSNTIQIGTVKTDDEMTLWIGDDSLPLAAERVQKTTAGFMFLHGTYAGRSNYTFAHTPNRLMVARLETNDSGAGMGQNVEKTAVQTLTLH
jgi:hypothetical protein